MFFPVSSSSYCFDMDYGCRSITTYILTLRPSCFLDSWLAQDYSKWVICRVYERDLDEDDSGTDQLSCLDEVFLSLDDLDEISLPK